VRQTAFEVQHEEEWRRFEAWLERNERLRRRRNEVPPMGALHDRDVPGAYRHLCQHLALARDRQYSPQLVDRLNRLVLRGHHLLYGARATSARGALGFLLGGFPRLVREEWRIVAAGMLLFFVPLALLYLAVHWQPDFVHRLFEPRTLAQLQEMYSPSNPRIGAREADDNVAMFGFYIWNNIKIGFQTFATGLAFGLGSVFYLVSNGVYIGAIAGYLTDIGYGTQFWPFVVGHSALELTAIGISGGAGLRLGAALVAPGARSRKAALMVAAQPAIRLVYGAALMFLGAAFIEAFWSPLTSFPPASKYAAGLALWCLVIAYFVFGGRGRAA
jgi:uncharacterized membrane protein SpoIIM required for sporulation